MCLQLTGRTWTKMTMTSQVGSQVERTYAWWHQNVQHSKRHNTHAQFNMCLAPLNTQVQRDIPGRRRPRIKVRCSCHPNSSEKNSVMGLVAYAYSPRKSKLLQSYEQGRIQRIHLQREGASRGSGGSATSGVQEVRGLSPLKLAIFCNYNWINLGQSWRDKSML